MSRPISTESKFRALAHSTRRRIIELLARRSQTPGELAEYFQHTRPVLSRHLRILEETGFVARQHRGPNLNYRLVPGALDSVRKWVERLSRRS